jgi:hypothetical protein
MGSARGGVAFLPGRPRRERQPPMGHVEHIAEAGTSTRGKRLGWRPCLRKGCGRRYPAGHWRQRYCRKPDCLLELRRWQGAKRQRKRRATAEGRKKHAEAERERRQRKKNLASSPGVTSESSSLADPARGHAKRRSRKIFPGPICDRPGCFERPRFSPRAPARYCGDECRQAMRRVQDRERKWGTRNSKAERPNRRLECQAATQKRRQGPFAASRGDSGNAFRIRLKPLGSAVRNYGPATQPTLPSMHPQDHEASTHDPQASDSSRPRAPPAC